MEEEKDDFEKEFQAHDEDIDLQELLNPESDEADLEWQRQRDLEKERNFVSEEERQEHLPHIMEIFQEIKEKVDDFSTEDPTREIIAYNQEAIDFAVREVRSGRSSSWEMESWLASERLTGSEKIMQKHERFEKIKEKEASIERAREAGKISSEKAESLFRILSTQKSKLKTASALDGVGIPYEKLGNLAEEYDNTVKRVAFPAEMEMLENIKDSFEKEFENKEEEDEF